MDKFVSDRIRVHIKASSLAEEETLVRTSLTFDCAVPMSRRWLPERVREAPLAGKLSAASHAAIWI